MFEGINNSIGVDVERVQVSWLFGDWLRVTAGRKHMAWGYYNDTYHHGNIFELTTSRPYSVDFEDSLGIVMSHLIGFSASTARSGSDRPYLRYDVEAGNPRSADITAVSVQYAQSTARHRQRAPPAHADRRPDPRRQRRCATSSRRSLRLRQGRPTRPVDRGARRRRACRLHRAPPPLRHRGVRDAAQPGRAWRRRASTARFASSATRSARSPRTCARSTSGFPASNDIIFQYLAGERARGKIVGANSVYAGIQDFFDLRVGVKWMVMPQLAIKLEADRLGRDGQHMEYGTAQGSVRVLMKPLSLFPAWPLALGLGLAAALTFAGPRATAGGAFIFVVNARNPTAAVSASDVKRLASGGTKVWEGGAVVQLGIIPGDAPETQYLAATMETTVRELMSLLQQQVFKGELRRPAILRSSADCVASPARAREASVSRRAGRPPGTARAYSCSSERAGRPSWLQWSRSALWPAAAPS